MHAGPLQAVLTTPLLGQVRQVPPHERCPLGQVAGTHTPPLST